MPTAPNPFSLIAGIILLIIYVPYSAHGETLEDLKAGVVKITATVEKQDRIGTGFIVRIDDDTAYIVTASHVVVGAALKVNFYPKPDAQFSGEIKVMDGGNSKGLAVVLVRGSLPNGIRPLQLGPNTTIKGGEPITLIGFPRAIGVPWAIASGIIAGQKGLDLILTGAAVQEGNSGGPILLNDSVVGVLTEIQNDFGFGVPSSITQIALKGWGVPVEQGKSQVDRGVPSAKENLDEMTVPSPQKILSGIWHDSNNPSNVTQFTQDGNSFTVQRHGILPDGNQFESVGRGTITERRFNGNYNTRYQWGGPSQGTCSGEASLDGRLLNITCRDSLLGDFSVVAIRQ